MRAATTARSFTPLQTLIGVLPSGTKRKTRRNVLRVELRRGRRAFLSVFLLNAKVTDNIHKLCTMFRPVLDCIEQDWLIHLGS